MYRYYRRLVLLTIALFLSPNLSLCQAQGPSSFATPPDRGVSRQGKLKNPNLALGLSLSNTVLPILTSQFLIKDDILSEKDDRARFWLSTYGVLLGPSIGYFYAGAIGHAFGGIGIRLLGAGISVLGAAFAVRSIFYETSKQENLLAAGLFYAGAGLLIYKMISDIVRVRKTTIKLNEAPADGQRFRVFPYLQQKSPGLLLTYRL